MAKLPNLVVKVPRLVVSVTPVAELLTWDGAIRTAKEKLTNMRISAAKLRCAIRHFEHMKAIGEPFPGNKE